MEVIEKYFPHPDPFVRDYLENNPNAFSLFDYGLSDDEYKRRLMELKERKDSFPKAALYEHLYTYNKKFLFHDSALKELEKLRNPEAVMVVGGQQAGLLSGPMYTISKAISILKEAQNQEKRLGVPVLPVFWIAGEDHDWEEVNHVFLPGEEGPRKFTYKGSAEPGISVSDQVIDEEAFKKWWYQLTDCLPETSYTEEIYDQLREFTSRAFSFTDFFGEVMRWLFRDTGLIMLDAHHPYLRTLEKEIFMRFIDDHQKVKEAVKEGIDSRRAKNYSVPKGISYDSAHFFYHVHGKRNLMYGNGNERFTDRQESALFTKEELKQHMAESPHSFSTNVVTRPLMQEMLLPVLTFIAGPGEINYWSLLQPLFHLFDVNVPPVKVRIEFTFIPRRIQYNMQKEDISIDEWFEKEIDHYMEEIKQQVKVVDGRKMASEILHELEPKHQSMRLAWEKVAPSETSYGDKNWKIVERDIQQFGKKIDQMQEKKEKNRLNRIKETDVYLRPKGKPQERIYNILIFLNEYGTDLTLELTTLFLRQNSRHKIIYL